MRTIHRTLPFIAMALALAACESTTAPAETMNLQFAVTDSVEGAEAEGILPLTPTVNVGKGQIDIFGHIRTPNPCSPLSSEVRRTDDTITFVVTAEHGASAICAQVITVREYSAAIKNVKAGTYTLRVVHAYEGLKRDQEVVLERRVTVP